MKKSDVSISMKMKAGVAIALAVLPPAIAWLISAPHENPQRIFNSVLLLCIVYVALFFGFSRLFNLKKLNLHASLISGAMGGAFFATFPIFGGGALYFLCNHKNYGFTVFAIYITPIATLAYMKYRENSMDALIKLAIRRRKFALIDFSFATDDFPDFLSENRRKLIFYTLMVPIFISASIALAFSRSDWKYEITSPLWGGFSLAMLCLMAYGNLISLFYLIHYLRNKEKYVEFKNWPREQFIDRG